MGQTPGEMSKVVQIQLESLSLEGYLTIPVRARGLVLFAHGSGSSRHSPRNRFVAQVLNEAGIATLLVDLLTAKEGAEDEHTARLRFDIPLLAGRVVGVTGWLSKIPETGHLKTGYFGASTGAAAALVAAARLPELVGAVVSRGGRPDLAASALSGVKAPTLLIVGGRDYQVIELNNYALQMLRTVKKLEIVPGATHLFEEEGALEAVSKLASNWFTRYLEPLRPSE